ncbi:MAG: hypothetical protein R3B09_17280 [Nannocystaceae bacterium]
MARADPRAGAAAPPVPARRQDPLAFARSVGDRIDNLEASIPPQCYTRTGPRSNPCFACHTAGHGDNGMSDWHLQGEYAFSDFGAVNHWTNLFVDRRPAIAAITDEAVLAYVREDNYRPLRVALRGRADYRGYVPDLDLAAGFDARGFAVDGSGWRAYTFKPFVGTFWPTNGSAGDAMIRLDMSFRTDSEGRPSSAIYAANLAILEAAIGGDPKIAADELVWPIESMDERALGVDLDGDGELGPAARLLRGLPARYLGGAASRPVRREVYPEGTELLHSVRYLDPEVPGLIAARMKELRYARKVDELDRWAIQRVYEEAIDERQEGKLPRFRGSPEVGLRSDLGWQIQGFIEDEDGALRLQTAEEHRFCMGCHQGIGATVDGVFSFARKRPGAAGWRYQDVDGLTDAPRLGQREPEYRQYLARVGGGDELRANAEMLARFFDGAGALRPEVLAGLDVTTEIAEIVAPSRRRAIDLDKAYWLVVREQSFTRGRDAVLAPAENVHRRIDDGATELGAAGTIHYDGGLRLEWPEVAKARAVAR